LPRQRRCPRRLKAGVEPETQTYDGDDPEGFVTLQNLERMHYGKEERRQPVMRLRAKGMSTREIADKLHVTHTTVRRDAAGGTIVPPEEDEDVAKQVAAEEASGLYHRGPLKVKDRDGKKYPARRTKTQGAKTHTQHTKAKTG
jgi:Homeodomain-like domain